jgi:hypothetical protein
MRKSSTRSLIFAARNMPSPKPAAKLPDEMIVVGNSYSHEQVQELLSKLESRRMEARLEGLKEIISSPSDVIRGVLEDNEVSDRYFLKAVVRTATECQEHLIEEMLQKKDEDGLKFLAVCTFLPERYNKAALEALAQINPDAAKEIPEPTMLRHAPLDEADVVEIYEALGSRDRKETLEAAVDFISNYPALVAEISHLPDISVTELTEAGIAAIERHPAELVSTLEERNLVPALFFVAELDSLSDNVRQLAMDALVRMEKAKPKAEPLIKVNTGANDGVAVFSAEEFLQNLQSKDPTIVADSISHFLHDYNDMLEHVTRTPNLTVSEVLKKLMKSVDDNLEAVLLRLEGEGSEDILSFMSSSNQFTPKVQVRAKEKLEELKKKGKQNFGQRFGPI